MDLHGDGHGIIMTSPSLITKMIACFLLAIKLLEHSTGKVKSRLNNSCVDWFVHSFCVENKNDSLMDKAVMIKLLRYNTAQTINLVW